LSFLEKGKMKDFASGETRIAKKYEQRPRFTDSIHWRNAESEIDSGRNEIENE
jgi:hypothetical protein